MPVDPNLSLTAVLAGNEISRLNLSWVGPITLGFRGLSNSPDYTLPGHNLSAQEELTLIKVFK